MGNRVIPVETKQAILDDAKQRILEGHTLEQIAISHGIGARTLDTWLHSLGDEYSELRQAWIDNMLMDAGKEIEDSVTPVIDDEGSVVTVHGKVLESADRERLARARELWKRATWYAERRDARYAAKTEHKQDLSLSITVNRSLPDAKVIEADYVAITDELRKDTL